MPELIGIEDIEKPLFDASPPRVRADELPVFWACGVTSQLAVARSQPSFYITHKPGSMVVADLLNADLSML